MSLEALLAESVKGIKDYISVCEEGGYCDRSEVADALSVMVSDIDKYSSNTFLVLGHYKDISDSLMGVIESQKQQIEALNDQARALANLKTLQDIDVLLESES